MKKRVLALLVAFLFVMPMFSVTAMAAVDYVKDEYGRKIAVESIDYTYALPAAGQYSVLGLLGDNFAAIPNNFEGYTTWIDQKAETGFANNKFALGRLGDVGYPHLKYASVWVNGAKVGTGDLIDFDPVITKAEATFPAVGKYVLTVGLANGHKAAAEKFKIFYGETLLGTYTFADFDVADQSSEYTLDLVEEGIIADIQNMLPTGYSAVDLVVQLDDGFKVPVAVDKTLNLGSTENEEEETKAALTSVKIKDEMKNGLKVYTTGTFGLIIVPDNADLLDDTIEVKSLSANILSVYKVPNEIRWIYSALSTGTAIVQVWAKIPNPNVPNAAPQNIISDMQVIRVIP